MCNKFKFQHHELHPYWSSSRIRELEYKEKGDENKNVPEVMEKDVLALSTEYLKFFFHIIRIIYDRLKKTKYYRILTTTTQPAHVAVMLVTLLIAASVHSSRNFNSNNVTCKFIYAAATAAHFGSQIWMTFASGLSLYFSLPRHHFGEVQKILFPLYFTLTSILSLITLIAHLHLFASLETSFILAACFIIEFYVRLYLCDPLVQLICVKNEIEAKHGLGMEVGKLAQNSSLFESHEYLSIHQKFRKLHMCIAFSNIACIAFSTTHLYIAVSNL